MRTCVVKGCKSKSSKGSSIRFHTFPSDEARRQAWWSNIQPKLTLKDSTTFCELHFKAEDYDEWNRLRLDAVPGDASEDCGSQSAVEEVCRICLASDRKVFSLRDRRLQQAYNDVSGMTVRSDDCLPLVLCWECGARVRAAARCRRRARAADRVLERLLATYGSCGVTLGSRNLYAWHFKNKHPGLTRTRHPVAKAADYLCEHCGRKFVSMAHLEDHKWVHTGEKNFKCDICGKMFIKKSSIAIHMKIHNASRPNFECPLCGKLFAYHNNLQRHMFIHTGLRPYKCLSCGKSFTTSGEQRSHLEHVHLKKPWPRKSRTRGQQTKPWQKDLDPTED